MASAEPVAGSSRFASGKAFARQRRKVQKVDAKYRQQRKCAGFKPLTGQAQTACSELLDRQSVKRRSPNPNVRVKLPSINNNHESRFLLEELETSTLRAFGAHALAQHFEAQGLTFRRPSALNSPFRDISRILSELANSSYIAPQKSDGVGGLATDLIRSEAPANSSDAQYTTSSPGGPKPFLANHRPSVYTVQSQQQQQQQQHPQQYPTLTPPQILPLPPTSIAVPLYTPVALVKRKVKARIVYPQMIDGFKLYNLGRVLREPGFFANGYVFAPGYRVMRPFLSSVPSDNNIVSHMCDIIDRDRAPLFKIYCDDTKETFESHNIVELWSLVGRRAFELRGYQCNVSFEAAIDFFGLGVPRIRMLLEDMTASLGPITPLGLKMQAWKETPSVLDDPDYALRTVETTLVDLPGGQDISTVTALKNLVPPPDE